MKIALCQFRIKWEDKKFNTERALKFIKEASDEEADIILFPEMSLTGFSMNIYKTGERCQESLTIFQDYSHEFRINIGIGWVQLKEEKAENHYTIINDKGDIFSDYIKMHPFSFAGEDKHFLSGDSLNVFCLQKMYMSSFICYDLRFPEIFQMVSSQAHAIIIAANWPGSRREHWLCLLRARAIENQVYIIGINCVKNIGDINYTGDSCVISPEGEILKILTNDEGLIYYELHDDVEQYRERFPIKQDRKEALYGKSEIVMQY